MTGVSIFDLVTDGRALDVEVELDEQRFDFLDRAVIATIEELERRGEPARVGDLVRELGGTGADTTATFPLTPRLVEDLLVQLLQAGVLVLATQADELCVVRDHTVPLERGGQRRVETRTYWQDAATGIVVNVEAVRPWLRPVERSEAEEPALSDAPVTRLRPDSHRSWRWLKEMTEAELFATIEGIEMRGGQRRWRRPRLKGRLPNKHYPNLARLTVRMRTLGSGRALPDVAGLPMALSRGWAKLIAMGPFEPARLPVEPVAWRPSLDAWRRDLQTRLESVRSALEGELRVERDIELGHRIEASSDALRRWLGADLDVMLSPLGRDRPHAWDTRIAAGVRNVVIAPSDAVLQGAVASVRRLEAIDRTVHLTAHVDAGIGRGWREQGWAVELGARRDARLVALDGCLIALGPFAPGASLWIHSKEPIPALLGHLARGEAVRSALPPQPENEAATRQLLDVVEELELLEDETRRLSQAPPHVRGPLKEGDLARVRSLGAVAEALYNNLADRPAVTTWSLVDARDVPQLVTTHEGVRRVIARSEASPLIAAARARARMAELVIWSTTRPTCEGFSWLEEAGPAEVVLFDDLVLVGQWCDADEPGVARSEPLPFLFLRSAGLAADVRRYTERARMP